MVWKTYLGAQLVDGRRRSGWVGGRLRYLRGHGEGPEFDQGAGEGRHCGSLLSVNGESVVDMDAFLNGRTRNTQLDCSDMKTSTSHVRRHADHGPDWNQSSSLSILTA